jgi:hypothetical protein
MKGHRLEYNNFHAGKKGYCIPYIRNTELGLDRYLVYKQKSKCTSCGAPVLSSGVRCIACADFHNKRTHKRYEEDKQNGICTKWGCRHDSKQDLTTCTEHKLINQCGTHLALLHDQTLVNERNGVCKRCKGELVPGFKKCKRCQLNKAKKDLAKYPIGSMGYITYDKRVNRESVYKTEVAKLKATNNMINTPTCTIANDSGHESAHESASNSGHESK